MMKVNLLQDFTKKSAHFTLNDNICFHDSHIKQKLKNKKKH